MLSLLKKSWPFLVLAVLAFAVHLAFLSYPAQVVFDEVHFGKFVGAYFTGQYYFDIHPPLGKLMIAGFAKLAGVNPVFAFDKIGENLPAKTLFVLRFLPALFGGIFVLVFSWLAYLISRNRTAALIAGFLILLDNAFLVQSKFILVDIFLLTFEALTLCFFFLYQRQKSGSAKWWSYLTLTALFFGLTISIKWTGLAIIGIMGLILFLKIFSRKLAAYLSPAGDFRQKIILKELLIGLIVILAIGFIIYLIPFYAHFQLLPDSGPGDAFMSPLFQQELKYGRVNVYQPLSFWAKFIELNKTMYTSSANLATQHAFGSRWYSWPLNIKPVYYWNQEIISGHPDWKAKIYFSGNPLLWWLAGMSIIFVIFKTLTSKGRRQLEPIFYILTLGYLVNWLPFILIKRVAFLYHYLPPATYAILLFSLLLTKFWTKEKTVFWALAALVVLGFVIISPLSYGWPLPPALSQPITQLIGFFN